MISMKSSSTSLAAMTLGNSCCRRHGPYRGNRLSLIIDARSQKLEPQSFVDDERYETAASSQVSGKVTTENLTCYSKLIMATKPDSERKFTLFVQSDQPHP